jgi:hypothetical protein
MERGETLLRFYDGTYVHDLNADSPILFLDTDCNTVVLYSSISSK